MIFALGYTIPHCRMIEDYRSAIDILPMVDTPETFGLHPNADITYVYNVCSACYIRKAYVAQICVEFLSNILQQLRHHITSFLERLHNLTNTNNTNKCGFS